MTSYEHRCDICGQTPDTECCDICHRAHRALQKLGV